MARLLEVSELQARIRLRSGVVHAVDGLSFDVEAGETLGIVGESGCGKTMAAMSIMRLLPRGGYIAGGAIRLEGLDLVGLPDDAIRRVRGNQIGIVFQDPLTSLNPTMTIGKQIAEVVTIHRDVSDAAALDRAVETLEMVGVPRPAERVRDYPHQLSGGLRQRVMIAMALACEPKLLIADEPTTALDVTIQAQILRLLSRIKRELGMGIILITHDMGVIAGNADRVLVMYAGRRVETAATADLFANVRHPYTEALLASIPKLDQDKTQGLYSIPGLPPDLRHPPLACRFAPRCAFATRRCRAEDPPLGGEDPAHPYACFHPRHSSADSSRLGASLIAEAEKNSALINAYGKELELLVTGTDGPVAGAEVLASDGAGAEADPVLAGNGSGAEADAVLAGNGSGAETDPVLAGNRAGAKTDGILAGNGAGGGSGGQASEFVLEFRDVFKEFTVTAGAILRRRIGTLHAVSGVALAVRRGETFGLVGESGCGKTTLGRMGVGLDAPTRGHVLFNGTDLSALKGATLRRLRRDLQFMFQDPYASLDPRMRVKEIISEPLDIARRGSAAERTETVRRLLDEVGLAHDAMGRYPHEFSGGQRQRLGLARALALNPQVIVADEPVSALDVSIQSQILNLMKRVQTTHGLTYIVISHDLSVVRYLADRVGVMYLGKLVEVGPSDDIYGRPAHPYTAGLLEAIPVPNPDTAAEQNGKAAVQGELPSPVRPPSGCRFRTRCPRAQDICAEQTPELRPFGPEHLAACHFPLQAPAEDS